MIIQHNPINWLKQYKSAIKNKTGDQKNLRADIFQQTVQAVTQKGYHFENEWIELQGINPDDTIFYENPLPLSPQKTNCETKISVIEADCIETAALMQKAGYNPCVLNMASRQNPGGGVLGGSGAQEENIFRRCNIFLSLYQFVDYCNRYGIKRNQKFSYPLNRTSGGIYSKNITVFRGSENNGYCLLKKPFKTSFVSVPALNKPELILIDGTYYISKPLIEFAKERIRAILRIAGANQHNCLILSAFGCGAYQNPPNHVAKLFKEVFNENEFKNQFQLIIFSIIDDYNTWKTHNPNGNVIPFQREFESN